tara:strand:+ start:619 stop:1248 length:630 start_codon:yes stop_codon:yes gene_type:complete
MYDEMLVFGRIVCKYRIELDLIDDMNQKYEDALKNTSLLKSKAKDLAGRLDSELDLMPILQSAKIFKRITECMSNYIDTCIEHGTCKPGPHNLDILSCWMNDMKPGEYNPIHTHNDNIGYAANLYLKVPEFINDVTEPHKFKDGFITFLAPNGTASESFLPEAGEFYIFQADHMHCVNPFKTKDPNDIRRSMPLNFTINNTIVGTPVEK